MNESRDELEALARRLCEAAGWEPGFTDDDGTRRCVNIMCNVFWANTPRKILFMFEEDWLPLARVVAERDRLKAVMVRVEALADWWTEEMHQAKEQRQLAIAPEEILIEQRIGQLRAALEGK